MVKNNLNFIAIVIIQLCIILHYFEFYIIYLLQSFWTKIENKLNQTIPDCIKKVLGVSGFDNEFALEALNEENLSQAELYAHSNHKDVINDLSCCHAATYRMQSQFQFVPGHRAFILSLPEKLQAESHAVTLTMICEQLIDRSSSLPMLSELLKEFLRTAVKNEHKSKTQFRYSEIIHYFSIYIYMISGRNSYEIMSNNLPMPTAQTVCELIFCFFLFLCQNYNLKRYKFYSEVHSSTQNQNN